MSAMRFGRAAANVKVSGDFGARFSGSSGKFDPLDLSATI
jgi:hypothetical protein